MTDETHLEIPRLADAYDAAARLGRTKIVYSDLDGTLLGRGGCLLCDIDGEPSLTAAETIARLNRVGLPVVLVSGRTMPMLKEISRMLGWRDYIAEMGCVRAYDREREVVHDLGEWDPEAVGPGETPYETIERMGAIGALVDAFPGKLEYHTPHHTGRRVTHLLRGHVPIEAAQAVLDSLPQPLSILDNGVIDPPATTLEDVQEVHAYHVMPRGTGKPQAILADLARRGLEPGDAAMIGDSAADLDVRDAVGMVVLVRNALRSPAVVARAPELDGVFVTEAFAGEGWAEFAQAWMGAR
jgi:hydroxymethylpyrimidine pyrophosphatase-like HAD family hydrolase